MKFPNTTKISHQADLNYHRKEVTTDETQLSEQECLDVSKIMALMAEQQDMPAEYSTVMKRGASLLRQAVHFCTVFCQSYHNLKEQCRKERMLNDANDETD